MAKEHGFEHYEISNLAKPGHYSTHNTNYWKGEPYLGIGPSAHSFNGNSRQWNVRNNSQYINKIAEGFGYFEQEQLSASDQYNEYMMTALRTTWGLILIEFKNDLEQNYLLISKANTPYYSVPH